MNSQLAVNFCAKFSASSYARVLRDTMSLSHALSFSSSAVPSRRTSASRASPDSPLRIDDSCSCASCSSFTASCMRVASPSTVDMNRSYSV